MNPAPALDVAAYVQDEGHLHRLHLMVEGVHCGGCVRRIERELAADPAVAEARVNLTTRRLVVAWRGAPTAGNRLVARLDSLGYRAVPYDPRQLASADGASEAWLLRSMAVAGFAAGNVMLLSIAVWAGHFQDMGPATRGLLHWFSALIALPAIVYAARPFTHSAIEVLRHGRTNMDVPITLAIVLASAMSLFETARGGPHVYFDAAITLLFFLLIGRYLDHRARGRARSAAERLLALDAGAVTVVEPGGRQRSLPASQVLPGALVLAAAGERIGVDGRITAGRSDVDTSLITGESVPSAVAPGDPVFAGTLNLTAPLHLEVTAAGERTLLAEIVRLMEVAEQRRARYVVLADRVARRYAPVVHVLALATFLGWVVLGGIAWQTALLHAVAVLIITCPCALGLAVPVVQVIASGRLLGRGILLKSATALERLAEVDTVVLDKTGTLTLGRPVLAGIVAGAAPGRTPPPPRPSPIEGEGATSSSAGGFSLPPCGGGQGGGSFQALRVAASLAAASRHPLARALAAVAPEVPPAEGVEEIAGRGLRWLDPSGEVRLGSRTWCGVEGSDESTGMELWLARPGAAPARFAFTDELREDAAAVVASLRARGLAVELLSGDRAPAVAAAAAATGIGEWRAGVTPAAKTARLEELRAAGRRVLMVGDGLNDAPALAAAHVSLSPSSAVDISRTAADAIFQGERLGPVVELLEVAMRSERLIRQNIALAILYNVLVVPIAMAGLVTPLIAAISMSASSLVVVGNALRLGSGGSRWRSSSTPYPWRWSWASSAFAPSSGR